MMRAILLFFLSSCCTLQPFLHKLAEYADHVLKRYIISHRIIVANCIRRTRCLHLEFRDDPNILRGVAALLLVLQSH